jgi:hypothetical protein
LPDMMSDSGKPYEITVAAGGPTAIATELTTPNNPNQV